MQLYALEENRPISAVKAAKGKDYLCPECQSQVRVRGGHTRQIHFYHLHRPRKCSQHEKSEEHISLQMHLLKLFGAEQAQIERRFPEIQRIADVAWHLRKIIFEIQCSPISLEEVKSRIRDYGSAGYKVVWILHDKRFNKKNLSAAESFLRTVPCYFTDIDKTGQGKIYDQFEVLKNSKRLFKGPKLKVAIEKFFQMPSIDLSHAEIPQAVLQRLHLWKCGFDGDLLSYLLKEGILLFSAKKMASLERRLLQKVERRGLYLPLLIRSSYKSVIDHLLRWICKA